MGIAFATLNKSFIKNLKEEEMGYLQIYRNKIGISIEKLDAIIQKILNKIPRITSFREKNEMGIVQKMLFYKTDNVFFLRDVYGFRILVDNHGDIYKIFFKLSEHFNYVDIKDFVQSPKPIPQTTDFHRVLQITFLYNGCQFEVQITTPEYHLINEKWHDHYKLLKYRRIK